MEKIILANGVEIEIEACASLNNVTVLTPDRSTFVSDWLKFTDDNLVLVKVINNDGLTVGVYRDLHLVNVTATLTREGVLASYNFVEKSDEQLRLDALEESQETQDMALEDLGEAVSSIIEPEEE